MEANVPDGEASSVQRLLAPAVLDRAAQRGIPIDVLRELRGSGPNGRLKAEDLDQVREGQPPAERLLFRRDVPKDTGRTQDDAHVVVPLDRQARARATRVMADATRAARLTSAVEADLSSFVTGLGRERELRPGSLEFHDALLTHVAHHVIDALSRHPMMNARLEMDADGGRIVMRQDIDLGLSINEGRREHRSTIARADTLTFEDIRQQVARAGLLARAGIADAVDVDVDGDGEARENGPKASFTILDRRTHPPVFETPPLPDASSGALALGALEKRPLAGEGSGTLRIAWSTYLCLTYDHRLIDGADAARFLQDLSIGLRQPPHRV